MCKVYTGYHGTNEIQHGLCACAVDNPLAKAPYRRTNNALFLTCVQLFNSVKVTELPLVWERAAYSVHHLLFRCLLIYVCPSFL